MSDDRPAIFPRGPAQASSPGWLADHEEEVRPLDLRPPRPPSDPSQPVEQVSAPMDKPANDVAPPPQAPAPPASAAAQPADRKVASVPPPGSRSVPPDPGLVAAQEELRMHMQAFSTAAVELATARELVLHSVEGQLLDLAIAVAEVLVEREVERDPELHGVLAKAALEALDMGEGARMRVSPDAHAAIQLALGEGPLEVGGCAVQLEQDPSIGGLGCVVDSGGQRADGTLADRLRAIRRSFEDERRSRAGGEE